LAQIECLADYQSDKANVDRGFRGRTQYGRAELHILKPEPTTSAYTRRKARKRFRRRAAIETHIGHLKSDFRLGRNFLRGVQGDAMNLLLAATAANLSLWLRHASACMHIFLACFRFAVCAVYPHSLSSPSCPRVFKGRLNSGMIRWPAWARAKAPV